MLFSVKIQTENSQTILATFCENSAKTNVLTDQNCPSPASDGQDLWSVKMFDFAKHYTDEPVLVVTPLNWNIFV